MAQIGFIILRHGKYESYNLYSLSILIKINSICGYKWVMIL